MELALYTWVFIICAVVFSVFPLLARIVLLFNQTKSILLIQKIISIRFLTLSLVFSISLWTGGIVLLLGSNRQTQVSNYQQSESDKLLDKCFNDARDIQSITLNETVRRVTNISTDLSWIRMNRVLEQMEEYLFESPILNFQIVEAVMDSRNYSSMETVDELNAIGQLVYQAMYGTDDELWLSNKDLTKTVVYLSKGFLDMGGFGLSLVYRSTSFYEDGSLMNYLYSFVDGKILVLPKCAIDIPAICTDKYVSKRLPPPSDDYKDPYVSDVFGAEGFPATYITMYYPVFGVNSKLGFLGRYLNVSKVSDILHTFTNSIKGSFMYIIDDKEILVATSDGLPFVLTTIAIPLYANQSTSSIIRSTAYQINLLYTNHNNAPNSHLIDISFNSTTYSVRIMDVFRYNVRWWLVYGIPNQEIIGSVNETQHAVLKDINVLQESSIKQRRNVKDQSLDEINKGSLYVSISCLIVLAIFLVLSFIANWVVISPLTSILSLLQNVSQLNTDVQAVHTANLQEIINIGQSVEQIIHNISRVREFIPNTINTFRNTKQYGSFDTIKLKPTNKVITAIVVDLKGFYNWMWKPDHEIFRLHKSALNTIRRLSNDQSGVIDRFYGDKALITWNALKEFVNHELTAAQCAQSILKELNLNARIGISTNKSLIGTMGCHGMLCNSVVGLAINEAFELVSVCRKLEAPCCVNYKNNEKVKHNFMTRWIGNIDTGTYKRPKYQQDSLSAYQLEVNNETNHIMYYSENDMIEKFEGAVRQVEKNKLKALEMFDEYLKINGCSSDIVARRWLGILKSQINRERDSLIIQEL
eukprot:NODE_394_length_2815_cov_23.608098_g339_i0.p1 GENE.NODE_394_length_2815_cov_23.608098_g339_i0~~NODE_394_length_2815_cov_23.608098_g339_i0.p1  ORF type:complete len:831 (+),score=109.38 NODE_394_length_2815_cov_23.608098_g339_i0:58-2493(+)